MRFMPADIRNLLPRLFNMKYGDNEEWIKKGKKDVVDAYIDSLRGYLKDEEFDAFQQSYTK